MKKGDNWIENQGENVFQMFQNSAKWQFVQVFVWKLYLIQVQLSQKLIVIETNHFYWWERGVNEIELRYGIGTQLDWKSKRRVISTICPMPKYESTTLPNNLYTWWRYYTNMDLWWGQYGVLWGAWWCLPFRYISPSLNFSQKTLPYFGAKNYVLP